MEPTEREILVALKAKKERLTPRQSELYAELAVLNAELQRVSAAILAFEDFDITPLQSVKQSEATDASETKSTNTPEVEQEDVDDTVPAIWSDELSYNKKVFFILKNKGASTVNDIVEYINSVQPDLDKKKLLKRISTTTSALNTKHKIKARKMGNKNKYSLPTK